MEIRKRLEEEEKRILKPYAAFSVNAHGRAKEETPCDMRTAFMRDRDRILHSKAFRRLKDKTQVFLSPQGDHYRTRLTHTLEVSQIARSVARALMLNADLVEAIALGHDLGHTPFGHAGEKALNALSPLGFSHNEQSLRVVEYLEKDGQGLNLCFEVKDGIKNHKMSTRPSTLEGDVVRICDKIAYIHHDVDDALRAGIISEDDIPLDLRKTLGMTTKDRLDRMIHDLIDSSMDRPEVLLSDEVSEAMKALRKHMFDSVYTHAEAKKEESKVALMFPVLYHYYEERPEALPEKYRQIHEGGEPLPRAICDYISSMTDQYCIRSFEAIYVPRAWDIF